jgi:hypothetical protein
VLHYFMYVMYVTGNGSQFFCGCSVGLMLLPWKRVFHLLRKRVCVGKCKLWRINRDVTCSDVIRSRKEAGEV